MFTLCLFIVLFLQTFAFVNVSRELRHEVLAIAFTLLIFSLCEVYTYVSIVHGTNADNIFFYY